MDAQSSFIWDSWAKRFIAKLTLKPTFCFEVTPTKHSLEIAKIKEMLERESVHRISWIDTNQQLSDILTKKGVAADPLVQTLNKGYL